MLAAPDVNISCLRNTGVNTSSGRIIAFLDADMLVSSDWLQGAEAIFQRSSAAVVGGPHRIRKGSSWVAKTWLRRLGTTEAKEPAYIPSGNLMVTRQDFLMVGGFDEGLETSEISFVSGRAAWV